MAAEADFAGADTGFREALALNPNYATAHHWDALFLTDWGKHDRALVEIRLAQALDPLSAVIQSEVGTVLMRSRSMTMLSCKKARRYSSLQISHTPICSEVW